MRDLSRIRIKQIAVARAKTDKQRYKCDAAEIVKRTVQNLKAAIERQAKQIDALTAGLKKVSAKLEVSRPAVQPALNNH